MANTHHIVANFSKQACCYDQSANVQKIASERLGKLISNNKKDFRPGKILEIGCGTGLLSKFLYREFSNQEIYFLDPANNMLDLCQHSLKTMVENPEESRLQFVEITIEMFLNDY